MDRREFLKTCAVLGVTVAVPAAIMPVRKTITVPCDTYVGGWEPVGFSPFDSSIMVGSPPGRIYFVPGDADTIAEAIHLTDADRWQQWRWSSGRALGG